MKKEKGIFTKINLDLYKKMEKIRIDENMKQKDFLEKIINKYIERKK
jgi:hypothetical protein